MKAPPAALDDDLEIMRAFEAEIRAAKSRGNLSRARHAIEVVDRIYASSASGRAEAIKPPSRSVRPRPVSGP